MALTTAELAASQFKLDQMALDAVLMKQYQPQVSGLMKLLQNQTASINEARTALADSEKNRLGGTKVYMNWVTTSGIVEEAISVDCSLSEPELGSGSQAYDLTSEFKTGFSIDTDAIKTSIYSVEELVARGMLAAMQVLDEGWAKRAIAKLDAFGGVNAYTTATAVYAAGKTTIPSANYNEQLFPYFAHAAEVNRMKNYFVIDSGELFNGKFLADMNRANGEGKGMANLYDSFDIAFDMVNFSRAAVTSNTMLVDRNSLAFVTRTKYNNTIPLDVVNQKRYKIASKTLPGVFYDVYYQESCDGTTGNIKHTFSLRTRGDLLKAPEITYPSVLVMKKGA
jgi:hypothetical protein